MIVGQCAFAVYSALQSPPAVKEIMNEICATKIQALKIDLSQEKNATEHFKVSKMGYA